MFVSTPIDPRYMVLLGFNFLIHHARGWLSVIAFARQDTILAGAIAASEFLRSHKPLAQDDCSMIGSCFIGGCPPKSAAGKLRRPAPAGLLAMTERYDPMLVKRHL